MQCPFHLWTIYVWICYLLSHGFLLRSHLQLSRTLWLAKLGYFAIVSHHRHSLHIFCKVHRQRTCENYQTIFVHCPPFSHLISFSAFIDWFIVPNLELYNPSWNFLLLLLCRWNWWWFHWAAFYSPLQITLISTSLLLTKNTNKP